MGAAQDHIQGRILLDSLAATERLGAKIAAGLRPGDLVALEGDLGAGKTSLARGILKALGVTEEVPSPSFTLVQEYETERLLVRHYDLYRISSASEVTELGLRDALDEGAVLMEWPERAEALIPEDALHLRLTIGPANSRAVEMFAPSRWKGLLQEAGHA